MILIALGSNIKGPWGEPEQTLRHALREMERQSIWVIKTSSFHVTKPYGKLDQPDFINAVIEVTTNLVPEDLMQSLQQIEQAAGRIRKERWGPRCLDLDLLDYNGLIQQASTAEGLTLPHPGMAERLFVLEPLCEIAPHWQHPINHQTAKTLQAMLTSSSP